ncbi:MAG TPA: aldehyde dehydrogenase family protein [Anaerolineales bacterium]|nr:aldehyde dehydrogenase family protein [Anaerolineales bacterium]
MHQMFINGKFTAGSATEGIAVLNPATEEVIAEVPRGTAADVEAAVKAAREAYPGWRAVPAAEKAAMMHEAAARIRAHEDELIRLLTREEGKPYVENEEELLWTHNTLDYYAELGRHDRGRVIPPGDPDQFNFILKEPYGVVGCIVPWNYPLLLLAWKLAPALATGNTVVIKPSEYTPLTTLRLVEIAFQDFPPGVVNVVTGYGPETGEVLVRHPDVPMIAFTGSLETGQRIASLAGPMMKKLHLELGGKDPMVIAPDMDMEVAVSALAYSALLNSGQVCTSTERVYVQEGILPRFAEELTDFVSKLKLGDGLEPDTDLGPLLRNRFREKVESHIREAVDAGAQVLTGGNRPSGLERGFFLEPAVLTGVDHSMRVMREETFGPVIPLMGYGSFDEAVRLANDTPFGLGACLMTHDARLVKKFYEEVQAGTIWINDPLTDNYAGPFGGMKMSGGSRELGQEGLDEFTQAKHVHWDMGGTLKDFWYPYGRE